MIKSVLCATAAVLALTLSVSAQEMLRPWSVPAESALLNRPAATWPQVRLSDRQTFSFATAFGRMQTGVPHFLAPLDPMPSNRSGNLAGSDSKETLTNVMFERPNPIYVGGEVGFLYGISTGKHGGSFSQEYLVGEVGDDHFHIVVGAAHEETSIRGARFGR